MLRMKRKSGSLSNCHYRRLMISFLPAQTKWGGGGGGEYNTFGSVIST